MTERILFLALALIWMPVGGDEAERPNILWLSAEDIGPHLGCFGDPHAVTPHLDRLATEGVRFTHAFTTAGVCAPCRSGIITGMYQTSLGTHHMRCRAKLPDIVRPFTVYLREAGYYCSNNRKEDYQFETPADAWDESGANAHWRKRPRKDQPFFSVFNFTGCHESGIASASKYRSVTSVLSEAQRQDPARLTTLPPYYQDTPTVREDWKRNYELITAMDYWVGDLLRQLEEDGLRENTIVLFWSDHGVGLPRAKRWLYDSGVHVPLIVSVPEKWRQNVQGSSGSRSDRLISSIDYAPTVLNLAGIDLPGHLQGQPFLGPNLPPERQYVYGARDRMDERYDIIRMVRDRRFKYLRNYEPHKTYYQYVSYSEKGGTLREMRRLFETGKLTESAAGYFAPSKPAEELYDTRNDPHELNNLAADPRYRNRLRRMRAAQSAWAEATLDLGFIAEPLLEELERKYGSRYGILRRSGGREFFDRLARAAADATAGAEKKAELLAALTDEAAAVRYWGAVGLANLGAEAGDAEEAVAKALRDPELVVRTAAARAMCRLGKPESALPVLVSVLETGSQWERLHAALVLDEINDQARPVIKAMRQALQPRAELFSGGKYVVRVINRALNQLDGTDRAVR